jgi:guanine nucleotide-binding protein subunit beta-2-like 1 protein
MLVSVGADAKGFIWDINSKKDVATLEGHHRDIFCVSINKEENKIVTGGADNSIILWNTKGQLISTFGPGFDKAHKNWVTCCAFHPLKESILFSGSKDGTVKMWDVENNSLLTTFMDGNVLDYSRKEHDLSIKDHDLSLSVTCLAISLDGGFLFYGGRNNKIYIVNLQRNELVDSFPTKNTIRAIALGESEVVFAVGTDDCVMIYDCVQAKIVVEYKLSEIGKTVSCKSLTFVGSTLYCGLSNGEIINFEFQKRVE